MFGGGKAGLESIGAGPLQKSGAHMTQNGFCGSLWHLLGKSNAILLLPPTPSLEKSIIHGAFVQTRE